MLFKPPKEARYSLLGSIDSLFLRDFKETLDAKDLERKVRVDSGMKAIEALTDMPSHAIVDRGRLVGLWEYDPATESIAWLAFVKKDKALQEAVTRTENFVRDQLGDARSFSLDSPKSRAPTHRGPTCSRSKCLTTRIKPFIIKSVREPVRFQR